MVRTEDMVNARFFVECGTPGEDRASTAVRCGQAVAVAFWRLLAAWRAGFSMLLLVGLVCLGATVGAAAQGEPGGQGQGEPGQEITARAVAVGLTVLSAGVDRARVEIETVGRIRPRAYRIDGPPRLVIDARDLDFRLPERLATGGGLVRALRYGHVGRGRARIVADIAPGVMIKAVNNEHVGGRLYRVQIELAMAAPATTAGELRPAVAGSGEGAGPEIAERTGARAAAPPAARRPVVVIDPGHGGVDPGAVVNRTRLEKAIVLAVGLRIQRLLKQEGKFDVVMTRSTDVFVSLDDRIERSREARADLFLSLHADAVAEAELANVAGGASVYILSARASDEIAQRVADKENAADLIGGILPKPAEDEGVRGILVELLTRETEQEAKRLRNLLVVEMRRDVPMARQPLRAAAFHVLKQPETPAALIELGYMTNPVDLGLMRQEVWRDQVAKAIVRAVRRFFQERN